MHTEVRGEIRRDLMGSSQKAGGFAKKIHQQKETGAKLLRDTLNLSSLEIPPDATSHPSPQPLIPGPQKRTKVPIWVIIPVSNQRHTEERWEDGRLQGTILSTFISGLSEMAQVVDIELIKLTLRTPRVDTKITVLKGDDDAWEFAKAVFLEKLKENKRIRGRTRRYWYSPSTKLPGFRITYINTAGGY